MPTKPKYTSVVLIGAVMTLAGIIAAQFGLDVSDQLQAMVEPLAKLTELVGVVITIYGRLRANAGAPITQAQARAQAAIR